MAISQNIYFTFFSIGSFIPVIFHLLVMYYLFSIPGKSRATFHLAMGYLFMMIFNLAYVLSSSILHPLSAYHRWVTVGVILLAETHFTMFMLNFGGNTRPVPARIFLATQYCVSVIITAAFCLVTWSTEQVYHFDGHYWDFAADKISAAIGLIIMGYLVIFIIITAYKTLTLHGRDRWIAFLMGLSYLIATVVPSFTNTMSRQGLIDRELFQISWALFNIFGFFSLAVIYINNSMEKTNFLARVMGISFVTLLTLLQGMSYLSMTDMEKAFNEIHRQQVMRMVSDSDFRPLNLEYIAVTKKDSLLPDIIYKGRNLLNREVIPWLSAPPLKAGTRHYREISGIKTTVFLNTMERDGSHIEAGFSYTSYRSYVHPASSKLLLLVVGLAFIVLTGFRLFFLNAFVRPLKQLVNGVQQVNEGNLDASVPVRTGDEIGYLAESFNKMVISIRNSSNELDRIHLYLKNIIDSMPSILIGLDSNGRVTHWNMEAEKQTELTENEALGKTLDELASQFTRNIKDLIKITDERSPKKFGKIPITIDGKTRINDVMVYPLIVNGVRGAVIRVDDITDRVRFEEMMVQSEKMASVGGLAAGMAHEINNPLGGIMLAAQNISRRLTADMEKNIEAARRAGTDIKAIRQYMEEREIVTMLQGIFEMGERASKIVSNMLNFSRRSESRMAPTDILDLTEKTLELAANDYNLKKQFDFRHIEIIRDFDKDIPAVSCIVTEIQQVLLNLFKNAAQAMSSKKYVGETPHITLRIKKEPSSVRIEVEDNGPGIDESIRKRVFEPFFTTKNTGTGTGLGLSVSYFIITNDHKGTLSVDSLPGKWTRFIISIPYSKQGKAGISADPPLAEERGPE